MLLTNNLTVPRLPVTTAKLKTELCGRDDVKMKFCHFYGAFPLQGLAWPRSVWLGLVRTGSLYAAFPLQFRNWGSIYSNAV